MKDAESARPPAQRATHRRKRQAAALKANLQRRKALGASDAVPDEQNDENLKKNGDDSPQD